MLDIGRTTSVQVVDQWKFSRSSGRDGSAGEIERVQSGKAANDISERVEARKVGLADRQGTNVETGQGFKRFGILEMVNEKVLHVRVFDVP